MIETVLIVEALAIVAKRVLQGAGDDYLKGKLQALLKTLEGKKKSPQSAAVAQSYKRLCDTVKGGLNLLGEDPAEYQDDLARFIKDPGVFLEFLKPFDSPTSTVTINDEFLAGKWVDLGLKRLPAGFPWNTVAQVYKNSAQQLMTTTPELQGIAQVQELRAIRDKLRKLGPVVPGQDLVAYRDYVRSYYRVLDLSALAPARHDETRELSLTEVFVPQSVRTRRPPLDLPKEVLDKLRREGEITEGELPDGLSPEELERLREAYFSEETRPVLDVVADPRNRLTVILGDPGSGKSTLARYLALSLIDPPQNQAWVRPFVGHLPLLVELRDFFAEYREKHCDSFLGYLEYLGRTRNYALNAADTDAHLKGDGRALVIFDGLDEVFDPGDRKQVADWIAGFARHYSRVRVIVTSRIIGYDPQPLAKADFDLYTLQDLDDERIKTFARGWYDLTFPGKKDEADRRYDRLIGSIEGSPSIKLLAGNPMLLTILAIIGRHRELPRERWRLHDHAADVLVHHWDVERHRLEAHLPAGFMNEEDKKQLLRAVAHHMQQGAPGLAGNTVTQDELEDVFTDYFEKTWKLERKDAVTLARRMIDQFHARNFILCKRGPKLYGFVHRAFLEYFCAAEFVERRRNTEAFSVEHLKELFRKHWSDKNWHEVLRLICGMEADTYAASLVRTLAFDAEEWSGNPRKPPWSLVLAVQCFGEMDKLTADEKLGPDLLQRVFRAVELYCRPVGNLLFFYESLVPAVADVGLRWPGREGVFDWRRPPYPYRSKFAWRRMRTVLLARLQADHPQTPALLRERAVEDRHPYPRAAALLELAKGWRDDPQTLSFLRERALSDTNVYPRVTALSELARGWRDDPQTLSLLRERAVNDRHGHARGTALSELAEGWRDDPDTLSLLHDRAVNDENEYPRATALLELAKGWADHPETLSLLRERAVNDEHSYPRDTALSELAEGWRDDPDTLSLLHDRAVNDENKAVRRRALLELVDRWWDDPQTLSLLHDRAVKDASHAVRARAFSELAKGWRDDPQTLSLLRERAVDDRHSDPRCRALSELANGWPDDPGTLTLLRERAVNDKYGFARGTALSALAKGWRDDPRTLSLLRDRAIKDEAWVPRSLALSELAKGWRDDPQTLSLLRERAVNDEHEVVRGTALSELANRWADDPEVRDFVREQRAKQGN